jgi:hypothetical protein
LNQTVYPYLFSETIYHTPPQVVVVIARPWESYSPDDKALLSKILAAVRINLAAVKIVTQPALALASLAVYSASKVLVFGAQSDGLKSYEGVQAQGFTVLKADDLSALDDAKKKSLWLALKSMFGV